MTRRARLISGLLLTLAAATAWAGPTVRDDDGHTITLAAPARRIVALSPQLVELTDAAGAGAHLVATVATPDLPLVAAPLPRVGDAFALNLEAIAALHPDLILAWSGGTPPRQVDALARLGVPVYWSRTDTLERIASTVQRIGELAGTPATATTWAQAFDARLAALRKRYAERTPVRVFFQLWPQPLMTPGGAQMFSEAIAVCGGVNPFADLAVPVATVSREAVLTRDPQIILSASQDPHALDAWPHAAPHARLARLDPRLLPRMGEHMLDGVEQMCARIDDARH